MIVSLAGCESKSNERVVRLSWNISYGSVMQCIMKEKGILEKYVPEGVTIEWSHVEGATEIRDAAVAGKLDIAAVSLSTFVSSYENGFPFTLLSYDGASLVNLYSNDPQITTIDDFTENSRIAIVNKSGYLYMAFLAYCKENLGDAMIYDNLLTPIPAADAIASLQTSKDFNGAVFQFPALIQAEEIEGVTLIADFTDIIKEYGFGSVFFTNSDYYEKNPDIIEAFYKAQDETLQFIKDNTEETAQILSEIFEVEADKIVEALQKMPPQKEMVGYDKQAQLMYEAGILEKEPTKLADLPNYDKIPK